MEYEYAFQSEKKESRSSNTHAIVPLTVKQLKALLKDNEVEHQEFQHIVLVGRLVSCTVQPNKCMVVINDQTGDVELTSLVGGEKNRNSSVVNEDLRLKSGRYFLVVCTPKLKKDNNEWIYYLDNIREVQSHNEVSKHLSDVILSHIERTH